MSTHDTHVPVQVGVPLRSLAGLPCMDEKSVTTVLPAQCREILDVIRPDITAVALTLKEESLSAQGDPSVDTAVAGITLVPGNAVPSVSKGQKNQFLEDIRVDLPKVGDNLTLVEALFVNLAVNLLRLLDIPGVSPACMKGEQQDGNAKDGNDNPHHRIR